MEQRGFWKKTSNSLENNFEQFECRGFENNVLKLPRRQKPSDPLVEVVSSVLFGILGPSELRTKDQSQ